MIIDTNSWHFKLYKKLNSDWGWNRPRTICTYFWTIVFCIIGKIITVSACTIGTLLLCIIVGDALAAFAASLVVGKLIFSFSMFITLLLIMVVLMLVYFDYIVAFFKSENKLDTKTSFIKSAYKSFKDKTCYYVEYK